MKRGDSGYIQPADLRKRQVVEVEMNQIVLVCLLSYGFDQVEMMRKWGKQFAAFEA